MSIINSSRSFTSYLLRCYYIKTDTTVPLLATSIPFASIHSHHEAFSLHSHLPHRLSPCDMGHRWW